MHVTYLAPQRPQKLIRSAEHLDRLKVQFHTLPCGRVFPIEIEHLVQKTVQCDVGFNVGRMAHNGLRSFGRIANQMTKYDVGFDVLYITCLNKYKCIMSTI